MNVRHIVGFALALALLGLASSASAQRPLQQVLDLNRQGMEAYNNLEIDTAVAKLEEAVRVARAGNVTGAPLARTFLNMGIVQVGGLTDNASGLQFFTQALQVDANIQLDPLTSTPDIQTVFNLARQRAGAGRTGQTGTGQTGTGQTGTGQTGTGQTGTGQTGTGQTGTGTVRPPTPTPPSTGGDIPHTPVPEQLSQTAVPVFLEVPPEAQVAQVYVYYKSQGMREYRRVEMARMTGGYGYEIPCTDVFEPEVSYYIVVFAPDGSPVGSAGTQRQPVRVPIVATRTQPEPSLPGRAAPQQCSADEECPPGMAGCSHGGGGGHGSGGMGDTCSRDGDCGEGLICEDDLCTAGSRGDGEGGGGGDEPGTLDDQARFFIDFGGTIGFGYVSGGAADQGPLLTFNDPNTGTDDIDPLTGALPVAGEGSLTPFQDCLADDQGFFPDDTGTRATGCNVRVETPGFLAAVALRVGFGYYVIPRLALSAQLRFQVATIDGAGGMGAGGGAGTLANLLIGLRAQYLVTDPAATEGLFVAPFIGTSVGQIQLRPDQAGQDEPFLRSGLNGVQLGSVIGYHIVKNFGIVATPEVHILFPDFLFDFDVTIGAQVSF